MSLPKVTTERFWCSGCRSVFRSSFMRCPLDGTVLEPLVGDPLTGTTLANRFVIEECIGEGGMGRVYRAQHKLMSRRYAIKVLFGDLAADTKMRTRFSQEAEAASRLAHPNVISVTDFGESPSGQMYLVMDYVDGKSLRTLIQEEAPFETRRTAYLLWQLASGLDHAHQKDLVHRDFKPDNVIVTTEDDVEVPKILDFGIAHITEEGYDNNLTTAGTVMGTPAYMSPEHATGEPLDGRTDLFSLGVVLYQMLSGRLPFDGAGPALVQQNMSAQPPRIHVRVPGLSVDPDLESMALQLMAKQPVVRFQTARELIDTLIECGLIATTPSSSSIAPRRTMLRTATEPPKSFAPPDEPRAAATPLIAIEPRAVAPADDASQPDTLEEPVAQPDTLEEPVAQPYTGLPSLRDAKPFASSPDLASWSEQGMHTHVVSLTLPSSGGSRKWLIVLMTGLLIGLAALVFVLSSKTDGSTDPSALTADAGAQVVAVDLHDSGTSAWDASVADAADPVIRENEYLDAGTPDARRKTVRPRYDQITVADFKERYNQVAGLIDQLITRHPKSAAARRMQSQFLKIDYMGSINDKAKRKSTYAQLAGLRTRIRKQLRN